MLHQFYHLVCLHIFLSVTFATPAATDMSQRFKVFISNPTTPKVAVDLLKSKCEVITTTSYDRTAVLKDVAGADALLWATHEKLDKELLDAAGPQLKVIGTMSAGINNIDLNELKLRGIKLGNTPVVLNNAVADIAMGLALGASRRFTEGRKHIEESTWPSHFNAQWMLGRDIAGSTVGIVGFGGIGQTIAKRLKGFDVAKVIYTGHKEKPEGRKLGATFVDLNTLTQDSDFIFLSAPLTNETFHMCNADFFKKMKKTGVLVNVARGPLVDQDALVTALKTGEIFAAGLDVMTPEPLNPDNELLKLSNVLVTPHIGSATENTRNAMAELTAQNILRGLGGEEMLTPVDL
ncbi:glyoxylate reductase/hydroxypyruvate reductase-like [Euwallacea fornicatus]|uniref:glyoxylate reductase/hydroxypyruvate reductase-like n=1 Tax=Euwallacea fornicatus TaxID=995702 RepID=UPI00338EF8A8